MKKFEFSSNSSSREYSIFSGTEFYHVYKDTEFLRHSDNIETVLSKGHELRQMLKKVEPGQVVTINGMWLEKNTPLLVKKTGPNVNVENYEFTSNRLSGLVAAYAYENRMRFPKLISSEAVVLGLVWDNTKDDESRLFLAAVSGTEHFYEQFKYWPLVCALKKYQLKKITIEPVVKIARIKNPQGIQMAQEFLTNRDMVFKLWQKFPDSSPTDLQSLLNNAPAQLKKYFVPKLN